VRSLTAIRGQLFPSRVRKPPCQSLSGFVFQAGHASSILVTRSHLLPLVRPTLTRAAVFDIDAPRRAVPPRRRVAARSAPASSTAAASGSRSGRTLAALQAVLAKIIGRPVRRSSLPKTRKRGQDQRHHPATRAARPGRSTRRRRHPLVDAPCVVPYDGGQFANPCDRGGQEKLDVSPIKDDPRSPRSQPYVHSARLSALWLAPLRWVPVEWGC
jgi:hypothetical protein